MATKKDETAPLPAPPNEPTPAQNLNAEESLLGAMLLAPGAIDASIEEVGARDFYRPSHAWIFKAIVDLHQRGEPSDPITVTEELSRLRKLDQIGGQDRLHELAAIVPATSNAVHYARIVHEMATLRRLSALGLEMRKLAAERGAPTHELVEKAEQMMFDLSRSQDRRGFARVGDGLREMIEKLQELGAAGKEINGVPSGFRVLDNLTSGFQPENLIILAARPSMGKSALAMTIAAHVALRVGLPVGLFSLEMSQSELRQRLVCAEGLVESHKLRTGRLEPEDWKRVLNVSAKIEKAPIFVDDSSTLSVGELRSKARQLKIKQPDLALVIVDYLQLMASGPVEFKVGEVSQISRSLKVLAGEIGTPVLALSQLSRSVENRHDHRPVLSDLRESGAIEQDADLVAFVYRDEYYNPESAEEDGTAGVAEIILAKHRNGPTGTVKLGFGKKYARFSDLHGEQ